MVRRQPLLGVPDLAEVDLVHSVVLTGADSSYLLEVIDKAVGRLWWLGRLHRALCFLLVFLLR